LYPEADLIPISALQHYLVCPRRCALIHLEGLWAENRLTAEGRVLHDRADRGLTETRGETKTVTGLKLRSLSLGVSGQADVVEFHRDGGVWRPFPVEYKRGGLQKREADAVQLCAQALCLEAMLGLEVPAGALFYGQSRRRAPVLFDEALKNKTKTAAAAVHGLFASGRTPPPIQASGRPCRSCSLAGECLPDKLGKSAEGYLDRLRLES
jgi:CRISPR-associated exonuclease Cas4